MICEQFKINRWQWANRRLQEPDAVHETKARPASQPWCSYPPLASQHPPFSIFCGHSISTYCPASWFLTIHSFDCLNAFCLYPILSLCLFRILFRSTMYFGLSYLTFKLLQRDHIGLLVITTRNKMLLLGRAENHILSHSSVSCPDTILGLITTGFKSTGFMM